MAIGRPSNTNLYPRLREAREALKARALEVQEKYFQLVDRAIASGDLEVAEKALRFLYEHMPADEDGSRILDASVDREKKESSSKGPIVNIGFQLGGVQKPKELAPTIEVIEDTDEPGE